MAYIFEAVSAHQMLADTIYGRGGTRLKNEYLACTTWEQFFAVNAHNTSLFIKNFKFEDTFPEAEPFILEYPDVIARYAHRVLNSTWPDGEVVLLSKIAGGIPNSQHVDSVFAYALVFYKDSRWVELEEAILALTSPLNKARLCHVYLTAVASDRVPEMEQAIFLALPIDFSVDYLVKKGVYGDVLPLEALIVPKLSGAALGTVVDGAVRYATDIKQARWPVLESALSGVYHTQRLLYNLHMLTGDQLLPDPE